MDRKKKITFELTEKETVVFQRWLELQIKKAQNPIKPNKYNALLTYSFFPNELGQVKKVYNSLTGDTIDVTDYENF